MHFLYLLFLLLSCGSDSSTEQPAEKSAISGEDLYSKKIQGSGSNYTCSSCHALTEPDAEGLIRPGHPIYNAWKRQSWKNGELDSFIDAVNACLEDWMLAAPWTDSSEEYLALRSFLGTENQNEDSEDESKKSSQTAEDAISFTIAAPITDFSGGDAEEGEDIYKVTCAICHGTSAEGTPIGPNLAGVFEDTGENKEKIAKRARLSGPTEGVYDGLAGGVMPFWSKERLSDENLTNIVAWLVTTEAPSTQPTDEVQTSDLGINISASNPQSGCSSDHPLVGTTASLSTLQHDVEGTIRIIDNCTIQIEKFSFDGNGIDVRAYSGTDGNFLRGKALSKDIYNPGVGYSKEDVYFRLPVGITLDDFNSISIWCVSVGVSFGDASW